LRAPNVDVSHHQEFLFSKDIRDVTVKRYIPPSFDDYVTMLGKEKNLPRLLSNGRLETIKGNVDFSLYDFHTYQESFYRMGFRSVLSRLSGVHDFFGAMVEPTDLPIGRVSPIQERGCKLRAVANPVPFYQWALKPLGDALFDILKQLPNDYTHDQERALPVIQKWIRSNNKQVHNETSLVQTPKSLHAVDLSDATNLFPLDYQLSVLRQVLGPEYEEQILIFEQAARGKWELSSGFHTRGYVSWTKGQPLGLYPSFAAFALSHYSLLDGLKHQFGGEFCLVGDDVVILGDELHQAYLSALDDMQIAYSREKSMSSYEMTEFVGTIIRGS